MTPEITVLCLSAAAIAFFHTLLGPDHYLPFVAMARARGWAIDKTLKITLICGIGHLAGSIALGLIGIYVGWTLWSLEWVEGVRGNLSAWLMVGFGLAYLAWGLRQAWRNRPHSHWHVHEGFAHSHEHMHRSDHAHVHENKGETRSLAPWVIFVILVLGPCEPLIPLLMYPAARESFLGVVLVTVVFGLVTVLAMILAVAVAFLGLRFVRLKPLERYGHALAGGVILMCGLAVSILGI